MPFSPIVVAGMHRSGTGVVSSLLNGIAVNMGWRRESNEESRFFLRINEWMLHQAGGAWFTPGTFAESCGTPDFIEQLEAEVRRELRSITRVEHFGFRPSEPWGFKDPRTTITFPVWNRIFPTAKVILIRRNGLDVARSVYVRATKARTKQRALDRSILFGRRVSGDRFRNALAGLTMDRAIQLWSDYCDAEDHIKSAIGDSALSIRYEELLTAPEETLTKISAHVGTHTPSALVAELATKVRSTNSTPATYSGDHPELIATLLSKHGYHHGA